ncbi:hypothetical protein ACI514_21150 [Pseudomonas sp. M20]|uniref:hypothetical protein n=1 Tax=Pseudomonas sp. M20 TaxID=3379129 RepID=UPI003867A36A
MIDQIAALNSLRKDLPDAIGWTTMGPYLYHAPAEMVSGETRYTCTQIALYNESDSTLADVKLLYRGNFEFVPLITYSRHEAAVKWEHNAADKELVLKQVPPNEEVDISIYNPRDFEVVQVLVNGRKITDFMTRRALAKAYPTPLRWRIAFPVLGILVLGALSYTSWRTYSMVKSNMDYERDYSLLSTVPNGFSGCHPYVFDNPPNDSSEKQLERLLKQQNQWMDFILAMNKVSLPEELHLKDRVVLCKSIEKS